MSSKKLMVGVIRDTASEITAGDKPLVSVDSLGEALHFLHMNGIRYVRAELTAPWALVLPALLKCQFR